MENKELEQRLIDIASKLGHPASVDIVYAKALFEAGKKEGIQIGTLRVVEWIKEKGLSKSFLDRWDEWQSQVKEWGL